MAAKTAGKKKKKSASRRGIWKASAFFAASLLVFLLAVDREDLPESVQRSAATGAIYDARAKTFAAAPALLPPALRDDLLAKPERKKDDGGAGYSAQARQSLDVLIEEEVKTR